MKSWTILWPPRYRERKILKRLTLSSIVIAFLGVAFMACWMVVEPTASVVRPTLTLEAVAVAAGQAQPPGITYPPTDTTVFTTYLPAIFRPFIFRSDFENGLAGFDDFVAQQGATFEITDDPTGSGRSRVLKGTISGSPADQGGYLTYRAHPGKSFAFQPFPCRVQEDIWMSRRLYQDTQREGNWDSELSLFDRTAQDGDKWHVAVTTVMINDAAHREYMTLDIQDPDSGIQIFTPILENAPRFSPEQWHTMAVEVSESGVAYLYQDNTLVTKGELLSTSRKGLANARGGPIYGGPSFSEDGYAFVDNFEVVCGP